MNAELSEKSSSVDGAPGVVPLKMKEQVDIMDDMLLEKNYESDEHKNKNK